MTETATFNDLDLCLKCDCGETVGCLLRSAEELLDNIRNRIRDWPVYLGEVASDDDCVELGASCLNALTDILRLRKEVKDVESPVDRETVESVVSTLLSPLRECRDFLQEDAGNHIGVFTPEGFCFDACGSESGLKRVRFHYCHPRLTRTHPFRDEVAAPCLTW